MYSIALIIEPVYDPNAGGVQRTTSKLLKIFKEKGHRLFLICLHNTKINPEFENGDFQTYYIYGENAPSKLTKILQENKIDICINQSGYSYDITKLLSNNIPEGTKLINTLRINPLSFYSNYKFTIQKYLERKGLGFLNFKLVHFIILQRHILKQRKEIGYILTNVDSYIMLSETFREELFFLVPKAKEFNSKIEAISNPFVTPEALVENKDKENIILYVGRLEQNQKRVDLLMEIWKKLHQEIPDWNFWVVGEGDQENYMKDFCKINKLDRVKFFGKQNPIDFYKRSKIFHFTSAFEGFGNVLVETQSYGCVPILFDSYPAAKEIVNHERDGILIKPFDIDTYVSETIKLTKNNDLLIEMQKNGFENVKRYSFQSTYLKWENIFKSIV
jgi:glycosyltransferase involved in cell wall biosynthesis